MTKYAKRRDANQSSIERLLTAYHYPYIDTSPLGRGFPDLIVLDRGRWVRLMEVKNLETAYGRRGLNENQSKLEQRGWPIDVVADADDLLTVFKQWEKRR